jgi:hypothetical protein
MIVKVLAFLFWSKSIATEYRGLRGQWLRLKADTTLSEVTRAPLLVGKDIKTTVVVDVLRVNTLPLIFSFHIV